MLKKSIYLAVFIVLVTLISCQLIDKQTATVVSPDNSNTLLWLYTPFVPPGGKVKITVKQYILRGKIHFSNIFIINKTDQEDEILFSMSGKGKTWGNKIMIEGGREEYDEAYIEFKIPENISLGQTNLVVQIKYAYAVASGKGFTDGYGTDEIPVKLLIEKKGKVILHRMKYLFFAMLILGIPWILIAIIHHFKLSKKIKDFIYYYSFLKFLVYIGGLIGFFLIGSLFSTNLKLLFGSRSPFLSIISWILFLATWVAIGAEILPKEESDYI